MNDKKFEDMLENWASHERESAPQLRPKKEMYQMIKAKKRKILFPMFARWATVGVAAATIVLVAILHPTLFRPSTYFEQETSKEEPSVGVQQEAASRKSVPPPASEKMEKPAIVSTAPETSDRRRAKEAEKKLAFNATEEAETTEQPAPAQAPPAEPEGLSDFAVSPAPTEDEPHLPGGVQLTPQTKQKTQVIAKSRALTETREPQEASILAAPTPSVAGEVDSDISPSNGRLTESEALVSGKDVRAEKKIGVKTFQVKNGVWVDTNHSQEKELIKIKRGSQAYHDLIKALPELKTYFEIEQKVIVNIGEYSIELADDGKTELRKNELEELMKK